MSETYLKTGEAAKLLDVHPSTLLGWAKSGKVPTIITLGGHNRYPESIIKELANNDLLREHKFIPVPASVYDSLNRTVRQQRMSMVEWIEQHLRGEHGPEFTRSS